VKLQKSQRFNLSQFFGVHWGTIFVLTLLLSQNSFASTNNWTSTITDSKINYKATTPKRAFKDFNGHTMTVVYLENLGFEKIGSNTNAEDVSWLLSKGYRVIELDYANTPEAVSPTINQDIVAINDSIDAGSFCGFTDCSHYRSYVLFEGYRIERDVPYFVDDPTVYNSPDEYTVGDSLHMDIIYPANPKSPVPTLLSFSYSNSYATWDKDKKRLTAANKDQRLKLSWSLAGFNDSFLEGSPAQGFAWAIADHPKYCSWGKGKPTGGPNDAYKSYETNPDAAQKVKSAIRTLHAWGEKLGLSGKIGIFGFSRGSTAGSLAIGDRKVPEFQNAGFNIGVDDKVQAAALGPGVFDYTQIYNILGDGDKNLEARCPWVWGPLAENREKWASMGAAYLVQTSATAPALFFYNTDDELYYQDQIALFQNKLKALGIPTSSLVDYGHGHSVPQDGESLTKLYNFFSQYLEPPTVKAD